VRGGTGSVLEWGLSNKDRRVKKLRVNEFVEMHTAAL